MIAPVLQTLAGVTAALLLTRLVLKSAPAAGAVRQIALLGFAARAILGQALFWTSYLEWPLWRELQLARGFWFFGSDGVTYFADAAAAASGGWPAILRLDAQFHSPLYVQLLAGVLWTFGAVPSAALLLNLFCHAGILALIVQWARVEPSTARGATIAIVAVSTSPALVLWSLQPLKDVPFHLLIVVFITACAAWKRSWGSNGPWLRRIPIGLFLVTSAAGLGAIRWYVGFAILAASFVFLPLVAAQARERKSVAFATAFVVAALLTLAMLTPGRIGTVFVTTVLSSKTMLSELPSRLSTELTNARTSFDQLGGSTALTTPARVDRSPPPTSPEATRAVVPALDPFMMPGIVPFPKADRPIQKEAVDRLIATFLEAWNVRAVPTMVEALDDSEHVRLHIQGAQEFVFEGPSRFREALLFLGAQTPQGSALAFLVTSSAISSRGVARATVDFTGSGPIPRGILEFVLVRREHGWKVLEIVVGPAPEPLRARSLLSGVAAMLVPRFLGEPLRWFSVSGGRGFFWVADLDTLLFAFVFAVAIVVFARRFSRWMRNPVAWLLLIVVLLIGVPMAYAVTNFGALFRLRGTLYLLLALAPMAATAPPKIVIQDQTL